MSADREQQVVDFFAAPDNYLAGNAAQGSVRAQVISELVSPSDGLDVIDLGCGDGGLSLQFVDRARSITLVDRSKGMLEVARASTPDEWRDKVSYEVADLDGFRSNDSFDIVLCVGVLAHVPSVPRVLDLVAGLVAHGGRCAVQLSDSDRWLEPALYAYSTARGRHATNRMSVSTLRADVERLGLSFERTIHYGLPVPGAGRLPGTLAAGLQHASWKRPKLARHAVEAVMLFSRA